MKKLFFISLTICLFACHSGKNHQTLETSKFLVDGEYYSDELFQVGDSIYYIRKWDSTGNICRIDRAKSKQDYNDSTFIMTLYFKNGNKDTWLELEKGKHVADSSWYENGKLNIAGALNNGKRERFEWYPNGQLAAHWTYDASGNGLFEEYYSNGLFKSSGPRKNYHRTGTWKRADSLGNKLADTVY